MTNDFNPMNWSIFRVCLFITALVLCLTLLQATNGFLPENIIGLFTLLAIGIIYYFFIPDEDENDESEANFSKNVDFEHDVESQQHRSHSDEAKIIVRLQVDLANAIQAAAREDVYGIPEMAAYWRGKAAVAESELRRLGA